MDFCDLLGDGYTRTGLVPSGLDPGLRLGYQGRYPAVQIKFRPALDEERCTVQSARDLGGKEISQRRVKLILAHVLSWNLKGRDGDVYEIKAEIVRRLPPGLIEALNDLVLGYSPDEEIADAKN